MIDLEALRNKFVHVARSQVGHLLGSLPGSAPGQTFPAVLKARKPNVQNQTPYIIVDYLGRSKFGWVTHRRMTDDGFVQYETKHQLLFSYTIYGGDAVQIAEVLASSFRFEYLRDSFRTEGLGAIVDVDEPIPVGVEVDGRFINTASFNILLSCSDVGTTTEGELEVFSLEGELHRSSQDLNPLPINVNVENN